MALLLCFAFLNARQAPILKSFKTQGITLHEIGVSSRIREVRKIVTSDQLCHRPQKYADLLGEDLVSEERIG
jgi:hypothetical protein